MQVKVFESQDMATGLRMVRKELGPDALILSTRTIRNGKLGLLGKSVLEITAAIDDSRLTGKTTPDKKVPFIPPSFAHRTYQQNKIAPIDLKNNAIQPLDRQLENLRNKLTGPGYSQNEDRKLTQPNTTQESFQNDIADLKSMVHSLAGEISRLKTEPVNVIPAAEDISYSSGHRLDSTHDPILTMLLHNGVSPETSRTISSFARESISFQDLSDNEKIISFLHETIAGIIEVSPHDYSDTGSQKRIALVGPTGVGKTTTLAKMAAKQISTQPSSIAFITIDTYRIAAVEQLKVYGEIMRLPVEVVISPSQLSEALDHHKDKDLILIDTAGRSPRDHLCIEELADFLKPELNIEKNLVLSAVTRETELMDTISQFSTLGVDKTIFTKIDECSNLGILLNVQLSNNSPLSCITNGQRVPEDLLDINKNIVSQLIIPPIEGSA